MDRGPRTGVTGIISLFHSDFIKGVGPQGVGVGQWIAELA